MATRAAGELRAAEAVLKVLANRRRIAMLLVLRRRGEMHVGGLADELRLPLKTVSRNLRLLERAGMALSDLRHGRVYYRLNSDASTLGKLVIGAVHASVGGKAGPPGRSGAGVEP